MACNAPPSIFSSGFSVGHTEGIFYGLIFGYLGGLIGVARCFYIGGRMRSALYDAADPRAEHRQYDDKRFSLDHFETKLFKLQDGFQTAAGRHMAELRTERMRRFVDDLLEEV